MVIAAVGADWGEEAKIELASVVVKVDVGVRMENSWDLVAGESVCFITAITILGGGELERRFVCVEGDRLAAVEYLAFLQVRNGQPFQETLVSGELSHSSFSWNIN